MSLYCPPLAPLNPPNPKKPNPPSNTLTQLLKHSETHLDATLRFTASEMVLHIYINTSYLSKAKARSLAGGQLFLSRTPMRPGKDLEIPDTTPPTQQWHHPRYLLHP